MMTVDINSDSRFEHGREIPLFHTRAEPVLAPFAPSYAVAPDGQHFLLRSESTMNGYRTVTVAASVPSRGAQ
jgi:hypothetical protein